MYMGSSVPQLSSSWVWHSIMIGGLLQAFLSLRLVSISVLFDPGCLLFVLVLVQEVASWTCHGRIFAAPASPLVWGWLLRLRRLWGFSSGGCPGLLDQEVVQQVMAVCDQWVWLSSYWLLMTSLRLTGTGRGGWITGGTLGSTVIWYSPWNFPMPLKHSGYYRGGFLGLFKILVL